MEVLNINKIYRSGKPLQYRYFIHTEVQNFLKNQIWYGDNITQFYDVYLHKFNVFPILVDNWGVISWSLNSTKDGYWKQWEGVYTLPSIIFMYNYPYNWYNNFKNNNQYYCKNYELFNRLLGSNKQVLYISHRCHHGYRIYKYLTDNGYNNSYYIWFETGTDILEHNEYYCLLSLTKYVFHMENTWATGQVIGESSVFGIPTFTYSSKYFGSLLMNRFMFIEKQRDWERAIDKFEFLEKHQYYYNKIKIDIRNRAKQVFLYYDYSPQEFIHDSIYILNQTALSRKYLNMYINSDY